MTAERWDGRASTDPRVMRSRADTLDPEGLPQPGDLLAAKYRIGATLGHGGMGVVVSGVHETLRQSVAIKFLRPAHAKDEGSRDRFLREARAAASLKSVHATRIFDVDCTDGGIPYIVMELLVGTSVDRVLEEHGALAVPAAVDCVLELCDALAEAHGAGLVHRDLKPSNLFLATATDGAPVLKVLDFGISKSLAAASERDSGERSLTAPNTLLGSPQYMSPEQVTNARGVDARTDIWAIGVILYELLTRTPPFEADSIPHLYALILSARPRALGAILPGVPRKLAEVAARCLEKDPAGRPADVVALAIALSPFGSRRAPEIVARMAKAAARAPALAAGGARVEKTRKAQAGVALAAAASVVGLAVVLTTWRPRDIDAVPAPTTAAAMPATRALAVTPVATPRASSSGRVAEPVVTPIAPVATPASTPPRRPAVVGPADRVRGLKEIKLLP